MLQKVFDHLYRNKKRYIPAALVIAILAIMLYVYSAPRKFPVGSVITVEQGESSLTIAESLKEKGIVHSSILLNNFIVILGGEHSIVAGDYLFEKKLSVYQVAKRITNGKFGILPRKITIPEGVNSTEIANIFATKYANFDTQSFINLAKQKEGYLFPDTYYFMSNVKNEDIINKMSANFDEQISKVKDQITASGKSLNDVIIMASILEEEARLPRTRQIVAGILWKRLEKGMPLQVDSTFKYINGKTTEDLTLKDLKIDSPYNTYINKGLPPTPIANPGLDAIKAAITPIKTNYLYFLTDKEGNMHYARTLEEHVANKKKYLK